ncbi:8-oxo-dGTP diphosphatase [Patescibacteria group bacterium]
MKKISTLLIIHKNNQILLGMKKRGFGEGKWNGFGGKLQENESIQSAAIRETMEEANIEPLNISKRAVFNFMFEGDSDILEVHLFTTDQYDGEPIETEEMRPKWFNVSDIPFSLMWPDDKHWMPLLLQGKNFQGDFYFKDDKTMLCHWLSELDKI